METFSIPKMGLKKALKCFKCLLGNFKLQRTSIAFLNLLLSSSLGSRKATTLRTVEVPAIDF